jgi:hypothetical protein
MLLVLLPTTNCIGSNVTTATSSKIIKNTLSQSPQYSSEYYLTKIKQKTKHIDYVPFIDSYRNLCKKTVSSDSFFIFFELINNFDFFSRNIKLFCCEKEEYLGIVEAFLHTNKEYELKVVENINENIQMTDCTTIMPQKSFSVDIINSEKIGSNLIIKIEDCFDDITIQLLYFLCGKYEKVFVTKPTSCWPGSSTKYVVCKNHKGCIYGTLGTPTNIFFMKIEELNCIFVEAQIEFLMSIFNKQERANFMLKTYQLKCVNWFIKHQIDYK